MCVQGLNNQTENEKRQMNAIKMIPDISNLYQIE